jgi:hypothetical protein
MNELTVGTKIDHDRYGEGVVSKVGLTNYEVFFARGGKVEFSKNNHDFEILEINDAQESSANIDINAFEQVLTHFLNNIGAVTFPVEIGKKWEGGTLQMQPGNPDLKPKELPIDTFFHKIVMLRDRLRVLEQNINAHPNLSEKEKIDLQQYITRIYGSLTTFNVLFDDKEDYFVGTGGKE